MSYTKLSNCKYCNTEFTIETASQRANHSRWCDLNPKRIQYVKDLILRSKNSSENQYTKAKKMGTDIPKSPLKGKPSTFLGKRHTDDVKEIIRQKALNSNHRRLVRSIRNYTKLDGTIVQLDSSWEEMLASRLDTLNIDWIRPGPMKWIDSKGRIRNYFPDFYLPEYNIFIDPKNPAAYNQQIEKVTWLKTNIKNLVFLLSEDEIKNFLPIAQLDRAQSFYL